MNKVKDEVFIASLAGNKILLLEFKHE